MTTQNHLAQTNHLLVINRVGMDALELMLQDFTLPEISIELAQGGARKISGFNIVGTAMNFAAFSANVLLDENLDSWYSLYEWLKELVNPDCGNPKSFAESVSQVQLHILTNNKTDNKFVVEFKDMFPISLGGLDFAANTDDDTAMTFSVEFDYKSYTINKGNQRL